MQKTSVYMCGWQLELLVQLLVQLLVVVVRCFDVQHDAAQLPQCRRGGVDLDVAANQSDVGWTAE